VLRWHAVPAISDMRLTIGGVHYPMAPFNGWYMGTEIGARNLADADRYDMLPVVAARLRLDTSRESTLWRDRALVELNRAVLWSFEKAGVKMSDHHTESRRFLAHLRNEERAGRPVPADWTWIVPPMSGSATPVFHRYYDEMDLRPAFYSDPDAAALSGGCARLPRTP
jgi:nitric-oxide synthase, bacterial